MEMFFEAVKFATEAHHGQRRKSSTDPYIAHPIRVAYLAIDAGMSEYAACAAIMHDCVEDCDIDISEVYSRFPYQVGLTVAMLTKWWPDSVSNDEKSVLMQEYYSGILTNEDAICIKILDRVDNLRDMLLLLPQQTKWVSKYLAKTKKEFPILYTHCNNEVIKTAYDGIIDLVEKRLKEVSK